MKNFIKSTLGTIALVFFFFVLVNLVVAFDSQASKPLPPPKYSLTMDEVKTIYLTGMQDAANSIWQSCKKNGWVEYERGKIVCEVIYSEKDKEL